MLTNFIQDIFNANLYLLTYMGEQDCRPSESLKKNRLHIL